MNGLNYMSVVLKTKGKKIVSVSQNLIRLLFVYGAAPEEITATFEDTVAA